mmetsp:Transcript_25707/g.79290  ORF Transcript_25707/g.79290 Transcript_25707/m.79290 type:complete len:248 (-) Transcript_25707:146-889(-)
MTSAAIPWSCRLRSHRFGVRQASPPRLPRAPLLASWCLLCHRARKCEVTRPSCLLQSHQPARVVVFSRAVLPLAAPVAEVPATLEGLRKRGTQRCPSQTRPLLQVRPRPDRLSRRPSSWRRRSAGCQPLRTLSLRGAEAEPRRIRMRSPRRRHHRRAPCSGPRRSTPGPSYLHCASHRATTPRAERTGRPRSSTGHQRRQPHTGQCCCARAAVWSRRHRKQRRTRCRRHQSRPRSCHRERPACGRRM